METSHAAPSGESVAVVLVHFGGPGLTAQCLRNLAAVESFPHRVIVVDHGPQGGLERALEGLHPRLTILEDHTNPGYGAGCNRGARAAFSEGAQGVWFLNNDATLPGPMVGALAELAAAFPAVALWGTWQRDGDRRYGPDLQASWYASGERAAVEPPPGCRILGPRETLSGASIFIGREAWDRLGPWPEDLFLYLEDTAWCMRAHRLGLAMAITGLEAVHPRSSTIGKGSPLALFYGVRNGLLLHKELHPGAWGRRVLTGLHLLQKRFFQGRWRALRPTWLGILAGLQGRSGRDPRF